MTGRLGVRARLAANLAAASSITFGLLALTLLVSLRADIRVGSRDTVKALGDLAALQVGACEDPGCFERLSASFAKTGAVLRRASRSTCAPPCTEVLSEDGAQQLVSVRETRLGRIEVLRPLGPYVERASEASWRIVVLVFLNAVILVIIGTVLLERGLVRRLGGVQEALERIERLELEEPMLSASEADAIGRMGGTVRRVAERLREDRLRTRAYIDELERTNRALTQTREGLERSERLATVGRLAAGVAHEIGNPLAAVLSYVELLKRKGAGGEYADRIERETRRIDRIVRDLLEFARPRELRTGPVVLSQVVEAAVRLVAPQPRWRQMGVETDVPATLPAVVAEEHHATQVLVNLLINAADASKGSGTVRVRARVVEGGVEVIVADEGPGIPPEDRSRLFDPFFTTKAPGEGTGLGLAICHRTMEAFGGSIRVEDNQPRGAAFVLRFRTWAA